ncbi:hypothetical protein C4D60_Mb02t19920 [Musa balbisiana]|uniref:Uncharacterized protein n=1 Tax=Musa balbisiana TaxID=52838 RepID=A0A4S8IEC2_MUSBA|nr:hypothetical protein C4D60_Mb02t19920 [Musa balbisiana]
MTVKLSKAEKKVVYDKKLCSLLDEYSKVLIAVADNVGSNQLQNIRKGLRGDSIVLMGKNTLIRRCIRIHAEKTGNKNYLNLLPLLVGNVGLIFTKGDLKEVSEEVAKYKVGAPARVGLVAPIDVVVPPGNTGLDPSQTSFFQVLNIPTKINKGTVEIITPVELIKKGEKVGSSEAALLAKLGIRPFSYGLVILSVYDNGSVFSPEVLDLSEDDLIEKFAAGVSMVTSLSLAVSYPTLAAAPHMFINAYKNVLAVAIATEYTFPQAEKVKEYLEGILTTLSQSHGKYKYDYATVPFLAEVFKVLSEEEVVNPTVDGDCSINYWDNYKPEYLMKKNNDTLYWQNVQLYTYIPLSAVSFGAINMARLMMDDFRVGFENGPWWQRLLNGYTVTTWLVVLNLGSSGLLVSWLMKYADNIVKVYSTSMAMLLTMVVSIFLFSLKPTLQTRSQEERRKEEQHGLHQPVANLSLAASAQGKQQQRDLHCFRMPLHYPRYTRADYESMPEWKLDYLLRERQVARGQDGALEEVYVPSRKGHFMDARKNVVEECTRHLL